MSKRSKRKLEWFIGLFWAVALFVTTLLVATQNNDTPKLELYQRADYSIEQFNS